MWQRSSRCKADTPMCVEVADLDQPLILVRDSEDPNGPNLLFTRDEWEAFVIGVKNGEFDLR